MYTCTEEFRTHRSTGEKENNAAFIDPHLAAQGQRLKYFVLLTDYSTCAFNFLALKFHKNLNVDVLRIYNSHTDPIDHDDSKSLLTNYMDYKPALTKEPLENFLCSTICFI